MHFYRERSQLLRVSPRCRVGGWVSSMNRTGEREAGVLGVQWVPKREWRKSWAFPGTLLVGQWAFVEAWGEGWPGLWVPLVRGSEHVGTV